MGSRGVNKVIILGNLTKDAEIRYTAQGGTVTTVSIATNESWKDKNTGQKQEKFEFHRVVFFGKVADIAAEYLKKGTQVYIEGKLKTDKWEDKNGQTKYATNIVVDSFSGVLQMLGGKPEQQRAPQRQQQPAPQQQAQQQSFDDGPAY